MTWQPVTGTELRSIVASELVSLSPSELQHWHRFAIEPVPVICERSPVSTKSHGPEQVFIIARAENVLFIYDDVEEEFGFGTVDGDGVLRSWSLVGDQLTWLLKYFPSGLRSDAV
jgi:hypothetical protein